MCDVWLDPYVILIHWYRIPNIGSQALVYCSGSAKRDEGQRHFRVSITKWVPTRRRWWWGECTSKPRPMNSNPPSFRSHRKTQNRQGLLRTLITVTVQKIARRFVQKKWPLDIREGDEARSLMTHFIVVRKSFLLKPYHFFVNYAGKFTTKCIAYVILAFCQKTVFYCFSPIWLV